MSWFKKKSGKVFNIKDVECISLKKNEILVIEVDEYFIYENYKSFTRYINELSNKTGIEIKILFKTPLIKKIYKIKKDK